MHPHLHNTEIFSHVKHKCLYTTHKTHANNNTHASIQAHVQTHKCKNLYKSIHTMCTHLCLPDLVQGVPWEKAVSGPCSHQLNWVCVS